MEITNIWVNACAPTNDWYRRVNCRGWHQRFRLWLVKQLLKSLSGDYCWAKNETHTN